MKNIHFERRREAAKRYKKTSGNKFASQMVSGVRIYHDYSERQKLSYWDDFAFVLGSQRIIVTWVHPRMTYIDAIEEEAEAAALAAFGPSPEWDLFAGSKPTYKKVGKRRKKVVSYRGNPVPVDYKAYRDKVRLERDRLLRESSFVAKPYLRITQWETGRNVSICYPIELLDEDDIVTFAWWLKRHLEGSVDIFQHIENYAYTAANWQAEQE